MAGSEIERRNFLRVGGLLGLGALIAPRALAEVDCTPAQTAGPFYPVTQRDDENADLTRVEGRTETAVGEPIVVGGVVYDDQNRPIEGALVEIWQASDSGRYDHPDDTNDAPLDPNFQYWGRVSSNERGEYSFKTIKPGLYPGRTRHIHFRVVARGAPTLVTQLYFAGEARNASDGVYRSLTRRQRDLVTTTLVDTEIRGEVLKAGRFDIRVGRQCSENLTPVID